MILDWRCPACGKRGTAVWVDGDRLTPKERVERSHRSYQRSSRWSHPCGGRGLIWVAREGEGGAK